MLLNSIVPIEANNSEKGKREHGLKRAKESSLCRRE
jgi:hypothetical protein